MKLIPRAQLGVKLVTTPIPNSLFNTIALVGNKVVDKAQDAGEYLKQKEKDVDNWSRNFWYKLTHKDDEERFPKIPLGKGVLVQDPGAAEKLWNTKKATPQR